MTPDQKISNLEARLVNCEEKANLHHRVCSEEIVELETLRSEIGKLRAEFAALKAQAEPEPLPSLGEAAYREICPHGSWDDACDETKGFWMAAETKAIEAAKHRGEVFELKPIDDATLMKMACCFRDAEGDSTERMRAVVEQFALVPARAAVIAEHERRRKREVTDADVMDALRVYHSAKGLSYTDYSESQRWAMRAVLKRFCK